MSEQIEVYIDINGEITFIYDDDVAEALHGLGCPTTRRASHVEPDPANPGTWLAQMVLEDVVLGPFNTRREALAAEVKWLEHYLET